MPRRAAEFVLVMAQAGGKKTSFDAQLNYKMPC